jgi:hypothetical protein
MARRTFVRASKKKKKQKKKKKKQKKKKKKLKAAAQSSPFPPWDPSQNTPSQPHSIYRHFRGTHPPPVRPTSLLLRSSHSLQMWLSFSPAGVAVLGTGISTATPSGPDVCTRPPRRVSGTKPEDDTEEPWAMHHCLGIREGSWRFSGGGRRERKNPKGKKEKENEKKKKKKKIE